jgi:hypothetical protein
MPQDILSNSHHRYGEATLSIPDHLQDEIREVGGAVIQDLLGVVLRIVATDLQDGGRRGLSGKASDLLAQFARDAGVALD